jgi:outer membrane protein
VSKTASFSLTAALALAFAAPAAAQQSATQPPSDAHVKALIGQAMTNLQGQQPPPVQGQSLTPSLRGQGPRVDLTADEAVARAMERNVTLASQRLTPRTFDYALAATWATYRPVLTSQLITNSQTQLPTVTIEGGDIVNQDTSNWNAGLTKALRWGGGNLAMNWTNNRVSTNRSTATLNPSFGSAFRAQYTQPLLQNFKIDNTRTSLLTTAIQQDVAELDLQATIASTVAQVRNAYWELAYATLNLEAQRASYDLSTRLVNDNRARVEIGTMAPIDVVQAQAEQATRRQAVVNAEATLRNTELALKRLIVSGTDDPMWGSTINAVDQPVPGSETVDLEGAVRNALANRTDLMSARKNIESANVSLRSLKNQTLPQLNLVTSYQLDGRGGRSLSPDIPITGWGNALENIGRADAPTWNVQLNFNYPLGTSQADANKARQEVIIQQNLTQIKATELQIATEITAAVLAVTSSLEAVQAAQVARELSLQRANAAQSKLEVGMATNFEVVQSQRDLADARNQELRELLNYRRALVDLQRAQVSPR